MTVISDLTPGAKGDIMRRLADLERQVQELAAGRRLEAATIKGGSLRVVDDAGNLMVQVGLLPDGTYGLAAVNNAGQLVSLSTLAFGMKGANVPATESTESQTFTDLTTPGPIVPDVPIGSTGRCLVLISALLQEFSGDIVRGGRMSVEITGATAIAPTAIRGLHLGHTDDGFVSGGFSSNNFGIRATSVELIENLNPGLHTVTAKYLSQGSGFDDPVSFSLRSVVVIPF